MSVDAIVVEARQALADLLGADPRGILFGRSATALTYDLARALAKSWGPGDEVVVTRLDHDANIRPWVQVAEAVGATVRWVDFDPATGELSADAVAAAVSERTRLIATTAASNLIGTRTPVCRVALRPDFWVCSMYKLMGPHLGVLAADPALLETVHPDKLLPSTDTVPERFELGTLPYELLAGATAAVDFVAGLSDTDHLEAPSNRDVPTDQDEPADPGTRRERVLAGMAQVREHEDALLRRLEPALREMPGVTVYSNARSRTPTLLFTVEDLSLHDVYSGLAERGVNAPAGTFYALECSRHLGLGDTGAVRVGLAPYTSSSDVERLITALGDIVPTGKG
jgi:selenocysteine lyase/cysteine desulfurase